MELLWRFAALSMCCCAALSLLREGTLRKTAVFVVGIMMLSLWMSGLTAWLPSLQWDVTSAPATVLMEVEPANDTAGEVQP